METYHYLHLIILGWNTLFPKRCKTIKFSLEQSCPNYWKYEMLAMKSFWHLLSHVNFPSNIVFKMIKKCQNSGSSSIFPTPLKPLWNLSIFFLGFHVNVHIPYYPNLTINGLLAISTVISLKTIICSFTSDAQPFFP